MAVLAAEPGRPDNSITALSVQISAGNREVEAQLIPEVYGESRRLASQLKRNILVDHSRARQAGKRGRVERQVIPSDDVLRLGDLAIEVLVPHEASEYLAQCLNFEEIGVIPDVSDRTFKSDWSMVRLLQQGELSKQP